MSEQRIENVTDINEYRARKEGTVFADEDRFDLHANNSVPKYDTDVVTAGRDAFNEAAKAEVETQPTVIDLAAWRLKMLNTARISAMRVEDKPSLNEDEPFMAEDVAA